VIEGRSQRGIPGCGDDIFSFFTAPYPTLQMGKRCLIEARSPGQGIPLAIFVSAIRLIKALAPARSSSGVLPSAKGAGY